MEEMNALLARRSIALVDTVALRCTVSLTKDLSAFEHHLHITCFLSSLEGKQPRSQKMVKM